MSSETFTCVKCKRELPIDDFQKDKQNKSGHTGRCKQCIAEYKKQHRRNNIEKIKKYLEDNRDKRLEKKRQYYQDHREEVLDYARQYRQEHKEQIQKYIKPYLKQYHKKYAAINRERLNSTEQRRRARKRRLLADFTAEQWEAAKKYFNNSCAYCGSKVQVEQEHFIPVSLGGEYTKDNIIPACRSCNGSKNNRDFFEWYCNQSFYSEAREQKILQYLNYCNEHYGKVASA